MGMVTLVLVSALNIQYQTPELEHCSDIRFITRDMTLTKYVKTKKTRVCSVVSLFVILLSFTP